MVSGLKVFLAFLCFPFFFLLYKKVGGGVGGGAWSPSPTSVVGPDKCLINMESYDELKEIDLKNPTCYYFDDIIKI